MESPIATASFPVVVGDWDVTSPVKLVGRTRASPLIRAARTDLETRLQQQMLFYDLDYLPISVPSLISSDRPIRKTIGQD